jgi:hypothetical protein
MFVESCWLVGWLVLLDCGGGGSCLEDVVVGVGNWGLQGVVYIRWSNRVMQMMSQRGVGRNSMTSLLFLGHPGMQKNKGVLQSRFYSLSFIETF